MSIADMCMRGSLLRHLHSGPSLINRHVFLYEITMLVSRGKNLNDQIVNVLKWGKQTDEVTKILFHIDWDDMFSISQVILIAAACIL